ncbi:precorrin-6y C5,15-methyltransferase (decarboxylating) subunit CbiE [Gudongella sp. SC589]|jgi:cobalt-precorrin-7 (C5)-methyltransferase|uniref:precorrin-6y C5,15-methyltransferase (decarboxylating) subunit CbiE n=1 Tax=Gudongella sp. SC589 TaxID=3385990 RepID=UPI0039049927
MLTVAGAGPGNPRLLTGEVVERIRSAGKVIAFGRIARDIAGLRDDVVQVKSVEDVMGHVEDEGDCLLLASGDPLFYGIAGYLRKRGVIVGRVIPGISSFQYMMSALGMDWQDAFLTSGHGRELDAQGVKRSRVSVILLDSGETPDDISKKLRGLGIRGKIHAGCNLSYEDELIVSCRIGDEIVMDSKLSLVVIENEAFKG